MKKVIPVRWSLLGSVGAIWVSLLLTQAAFGQIIKITYPQTRVVFQRDNNNLSTIFMSGDYTQPIDSVQARVVAESAGQGTTTNWQTIQRNLQGGVFRSKLVASNGWYRLQIQAFANGTVLATDEVRRVGVGEVFIITGQSNAQGIPGYGGIGATDDRVNCVSYNNITASSLADPPAPSFEQLGANSTIGPRGKTAWCWGVLGDLLVKQYNVPVLFINTGWESTTSQNWRESAQGQQTLYWFNSVALPPGMPYANLVISLRYYASLQGVRAILWQQGESDNIPFGIDQTTYRNNLQYVVNKTRADTQRYPAWILARSSINSTQDQACVAACGSNTACAAACPNVYRTWPNIINGQNDIINTFNNNVYAGPNTDGIQIPRIDGVHFSNDGLRQVGQAWYESMSPTFFSSSQPLLPQEQPPVSVTCTGSTLTLTLPAGYASYNWTNGKAGATISVSQSGIYQAMLKDFTGNTYLSPQVTVSTPVVPAAPSISLPSNATVAASPQQQICSDSTLTLTATNAVTSLLRWSNGAVGQKIQVSKAGNYTVQAVSVNGCVSPVSAPLNVTVQPRLTTPTVGRVGPYSIEATLPSTAVQTNSFDWKSGATPLATPTGSNLKTTTNGTYSARAKVAFVLGNSNLACYSAYSAPFAFALYDNAGSVVVYPNPTANGTIAIESADNLDNVTIQVVGLNGQVVFKNYVGAMTERQVLDLSSIAGGLYFVTVTATDLKVTRQIWVSN